MKPEVFVSPRHRNVSQPHRTAAAVQGVQDPRVVPLGVPGILLGVPGILLDPQGVFRLGVQS